MKATISPRASSIPRLRALETPLRCSRRWRTGKLSMIAGVRSVEALSTTRISWRSAG
jgi:hypothetical protein